ncbi:MAG: ATP-dependent helicase [Treponema sp.]|nr:ATP-dependent helicase [Treponema sp.]
MTETLEKYLSVLNEQQLAAVKHEGSPLLILAGAGSGKTRVITTKIAYLIGEKNIEPWTILAVTFTKKAANEMRERAVAMDERAASAQIRTFHSFGSWFLRKYAEQAGLDPNFTVYDDGDMETIVKKAVPSLSTKEAKIAAHQISLAKDYCLFPEDDLSCIGSEFDLNEIYKKYQERLRATGNADFGDLIMLPVRVMDEHPEIADYIHSRFKVIMVDEYQDSNIAQYKLLQKLSGYGDGASECSNYVCVVGDDDQSIYHFRGAEVENILSFPKKFPGTEIIRLERNYRSTAKILHAADVVVSKNQNRLGKTLIADRGEGSQPVLAFLDSQNSEATFCADMIAKSVMGKDKYSDWAILYRTNAQSLNFEKEFLHRKIPYVVVGSLKFYEREEIKDALAYIALCANPRDEISFRRVVNKPSRGLGEKTQDKIMENAVEFAADGTPIYSNLVEACRNSAPNLSKKAREGAEAFCKIFSELDGFLKSSEGEGDSSELHLSDFIERVIKTSGLDEYHKASDEIEGTQRLANLEELVNSAVPYECTLEGLTEFLDAINLDRTLELSEGEVADDAVTLITIHNTKGLEYNNVIITGLEEGIFPRIDKTGAELEEERRLFYVAITRARNQLFVTSAASRYMYGSLQFMRPSPFISEASSAFTMIGQIPFSFKKSAAQERFAGIGKHIEGSQFDVHSSEPVSAEEEAVLKKYKKGTKIYHDDYGYGVIQKCELKEGEVVAIIQFENGAKKKFLPKYQRKSLDIIK